ncbi:STAS domain-containing protein [Streptomyces sp. NPDC002577]
MRSATNTVNYSSRLSLARPPSGEAPSGAVQAETFTHDLSVMLAMEKNFRIVHRDENDWTIVEIHGEVDVYTVPQIRDHVVTRIEEGRLRVILDLRRVTFIDSTGLGVFVGILKRIRERDGELRLVIASQTVRRIFDLTSLYGVFPIYDSLDAALTAA